MSVPVKDGYEFLPYDSSRPSPMLVEVVVRGSEWFAIWCVPGNPNTSEMPFEDFIALLEEHYPWTIKKVERCPTCGR